MQFGDDIKSTESALAEIVASDMELVDDSLEYSEAKSQTDVEKETGKVSICNGIKNSEENNEGFLCEGTIETDDHENLSNRHLDSRVTIWTKYFKWRKCNEHI